MFDVDAFAQLVRDAAANKTLAGIGTCRRQLVQNNGGVTWVDAAHPTLQVYVATLDAFCDALTALRDSVLIDEKHRLPEGHDVPVFLSDREIVAALSADRRDFVTLVLNSSEQWECLRELRDWQSHREFVRKLRVDLRGCVQDSFVDAIAALKLEKKETSESATAHGSDTLGKSVHQKVTSAAGDAIPSETVIKLHRYGAIEFVCQLRVSLDIDISEGQLRLSPFCGEESRATQEVLELAAQVIMETCASVTVLPGALLLR